MVAYAKFLCKRVLRRKSNLFLIVGVFSIISIYFIMNVTTQDRLSDKLKSQMETDRKQVEIYKAKLRGMSKTNEDYEADAMILREAQASIKLHQQILEDIKQNHWDAVYANYSKVLTYQMNTLKQGSDTSPEESSLSDHILSISKEYAYIQYLKEHHLAYEDLEFPIYGLSFTTSIAQLILPVLTLSTCLYLLTQLFTLDYAKGNDISKLYPLSRRKVLFTKLMVGIGLSLFIYVIFLLFAFLLATLIQGNHGLSYPILLRSLTTPWITVSTLTLFKEWFVLGILFYICLTLFAYLSSLLIREDVYLFLFMITIVLGLAYLPMILGDMNAITHILPTTYLNQVNTVNGYSATHYANANITLFTGILVLFVSIIIESVCCLLWNLYDTMLPLKESSRWKQYRKDSDIR